LFDKGRLAVNPDALTVSVDHDLMSFPMYAALEGRHVQVPLTTQHRSWLREHWSQHRDSQHDAD
jgi:hypothetical protein